MDSKPCTAGDITIKAYENAGLDLSFANLDIDSVSITVNSGAVLRGGKVELNSTVDHSRIFQYTGDEQNCALNSLAGFIQNLSFMAGVAYSSVDTLVDIKAGAKIYADTFKAIASGIGNAQSEPSGLGISIAVAYVKNRSKVILGGDVTTTGDATINAGADNTALAIANTIDLKGGAAAFSVTIVNSKVDIHITDDAALKIDGNLTVQANTVNRTYNLARTSADDEGMLGIAGAVGDETSVTNAWVDGTVEVGKDLLITASHVTKQVNRPILVIAKEEGGVNAESGVSHGAPESKKWLDRVRVGTGAADGVEWKPSLRGSMNASSSYLANFLQGSAMLAGKNAMPTTKGTPPFQFSAAVAVANVDIDTTARIGDGDADGDSKSGVVTADGVIIVQSTIESRPNISSISTVEQDSASLKKKDRQGTSFAGSGAFTYGDYTNVAKAYIGESAQVDAKKTILVFSQTMNDLSLQNLGRKIKKDLGNVFEMTPDYLSTEGTVRIADEDIVEVAKGHTAGGSVGDFYKYIGTSPNSFIDLGKEDFVNPGNWKHLGSSAYHIASQFVGNVYGYLSEDLGSVFSDSVTQATARDAKTLAMAFAVSVLFLDHTSKAYIDEKALINQKSAFRSGEQHVEVKAQNVNELLNFIGNIQMPTIGLDVARFEFSPSAGGFGTKGGKGAMGVVVQVLDFESDVLAKIEDGASVYGDSLYVDAFSKTLSLLMGGSGGS
ncbi:MAG: hypothetical protein HN372_14075, partial [Acidiferrobacteraceae bacterium]|nr:hypothetical protein [Acidiferrobacteraceae bacterium]